ncbi:uncharacterized protein LOC127833709 [Dreissena polymorpha]|nr:uncharacterized protein LOC127833709 [Dreissena polymorpha]
MSSSGTFQFYKRGSTIASLPRKCAKPKHAYKDNDAKHKSKSTTDWLKDNGVSTMSTPPSSPNLNPIEHVLATLKDNLKRKVKPKTKVELVNGIKYFLGKLDSS